MKPLPPPHPPEAEMVWLGSTETLDRRSTTHRIALWLRRSWWMGMKTLGLGWLLTHLALRFAHDRLVYRPVSWPRGHHAPHPLLHTKVGTLWGWVIHETYEEAIVYFGANSEDVQLVIPWLVRTFPQHALYVMPYRGFNGNPGRPSEYALKEDARALVRMARQKHRRVSVVGRSLGTAMAVHVAAYYPIRRLILITPYDSLLKVARRHYPWAHMYAVLRDTFDALPDARLLRCPVLVVTAGDDLTIPTAHAQNLSHHIHDVANVRIQAATHANILCYSETRLKVQAFCAATASKTKPLSALPKNTTFCGVHSA